MKFTGSCRPGKLGVSLMVTGPTGCDLRTLPTTLDLWLPYQVQKKKKKSIIEEDPTVSAEPQYGANFLIG